MRNFHINTNVFFILIFLLTSCASSTQTDLLPEGNIIPGLTDIGNILEREKHSEIDESEKKIVLEDLTIWYENDLVSKIEIMAESGNIPRQWKRIGLKWGMDFQRCIEKLHKYGFQIQVINYPIYIMRNDKIEINGQFKAIHPENASLLYEFTFHNEKTVKDENIKPEFSKIEIRSREKNSSFFPFLKYPQKEREILEDIKREAIAYSGLLGGLNNSFQEKLEPYSMEYENEINRSLNILKDSWSIETPEKLISTLDNLITNGHSGRLLKMLDEVEKNQNILDYSFSNQKKANTIRQLIFLVQFQDFPGLKERSLKAWDYGRSISLCRWGYNSGFMTEEEAWKRIDKYRVLILELYNSWEDYAVNYALGRMFWASGFSKAQEKGNGILIIHEQLSHNENSPWNGKWNISGDIKPGNSFNNSLEDILYITPKEELSIDNFFKGLNLYNDGLYSEADKEFETAVSRTPDFAYSTLYRGFCERMMKNYEKAATHFLESYNSDNNNYTFTYYYGNALENVGNLKEAVEILNHSKNISSELPSSYTSLARIYLKLSDYNNAKKILDEYDKNVIDDKDSYYTDYLKGVLTYETEDYQLAIENLKKCYDKYKDFGYINFILGSCYYYLGEETYNEALYYLNIAKENGYNITIKFLKFIKDHE